MKRNELRIAVARWLRVAERPRRADEMIKGRLIRVESVTIDRVTIHGRAIRHTPIVYHRLSGSQEAVRGARADLFGPPWTGLTRSQELHVGVLASLPAGHSPPDPNWPG